MRLLLLLTFALAAYPQTSNNASRNPNFWRGDRLNGKPECSDSVTTNCIMSLDASGNGKIGTRLPTGGRLAAYGIVNTARLNRLCFLGDSITGDANNTDAMRATSWASQLPNLMSGLTMVHNGGVPGNSTAQMLARIATDVTPYDCGTVLLLGGTNDVKSSVATATILSNIAAIGEAVRATGRAVILATIPPIDTAAPPTYTAAYGPQTAALNNGIKRLGKTMGVPVLDFYAVLSDTSGAFLSGMTSDGTHPSNAGWKLMAAQAVTQLSSFFAPEPHFLPVNTSDTNNAAGCPLFLCTGTVWPPTGFAPQNISGRVTYSLTTATGIAGNVVQLTKAATAGGDGDYLQAVWASNGWAAGHKMRLTGRYIATGADATMFPYSIWLAMLDAGYANLGQVNAVQTWSYTVANGYFDVEFTMAANCTQVVFYINAYEGVGTLQVGQIGLYDLTAMGIE